MNGVKKEQQAIRSKIQQLDDAIKAVDKQISSIRDELKMVTDKRDQAQQSIYTFRQQLDQQVSEHDCVATSLSLSHLIFILSLLYSRVGTFIFLFLLRTSVVVLWRTVYYSCLRKS